jgi:hypothetical protein
MAYLTTMPDHSQHQALINTRHWLPGLITEIEADLTIEFEPAEAFHLQTGSRLMKRFIP